MYCLESKVRYSEAGPDEKLTYASLLNYFQDCSSLHSESLGASGGSLRAHNMAWVLSSWQICIDRMPSLSEEITASTWPYETKGLFGLRNFQMKDAAGTSIVKANSIWVLVDATTGRLIRIPDFVSAIYPDEPRLEMDYAARKLAVPKEYHVADPIRVEGYFIDTNHHMNNAKYVMVAGEFLPEDAAIREIRVEYKKPAVKGNLLYPRITEEAEGLTVVLADEEGHPYAVVQFLYRAD